jgi:predicted DNA-binding antitoxin AbrB/MazE fold protein
LKAAKPVQMESGEKSLAKVTVPVEVLEQVKERAKDLLKQFPLYPEIVID